MISTENKPYRFELSGILEQYAQDYIDTHELCSNQLKAIRDIIGCRTSKMKGHLSKCDHCGHIEQSYNSCRNRHCNKCQFIKQTMWVVYVKKTGKTVDRALEYLARYTNRVAIGNNRITNVENGEVTFRYKDRNTGRYNREMTIGAEEFIRRFIQHKLPTGFYKIRYFGVLSAANANTI